MAITLAEVQELALLARLRITEDEAERLRGELSSILGYVAKLEGLDTDGVEPMTHAVPMDCPLREDVVAPSLTGDEAVRGETDCFVVPKIIEAKS